MARDPNHQLIDEQEPRGGRWRKRGLLVENITAEDDGHWIEVDGFYPLTVTIEGENFEGMIELCVSNATARPLDTEHGSLHGPPRTNARETFYINSPHMWVKLRVTGLANGSITRADLYGGPGA